MKNAGVGHHIQPPPVSAEREGCDMNVIIVTNINVTGGVLFDVWKMSVCL